MSQSLPLAMHPGHLGVTGASNNYVRAPDAPRTVLGRLGRMGTLPSPTMWQVALACCLFSGGRTLFLLAAVGREGYHRASCSSVCLPFLQPRATTLTAQGRWGVSIPQEREDSPGAMSRSHMLVPSRECKAGAGSQGSSRHPGHQGALTSPHQRSRPPPGGILVPAFPPPHGRLPPPCSQESGASAPASR